VRCERRVGKECTYEYVAAWGGVRVCERWVMKGVNNWVVSKYNRMNKRIIDVAS